MVERDVPALDIVEACSHEQQFQGLCAMCGKDMTQVNWASEATDASRATVATLHDQTGLLVSQNLAARAEYETQRRLLRQGKLILVVDLDQTIIHACVDPTIADWQNDPANPNHASVKDVKSFWLPDGLGRGCWYYIKQRPGLAEFLDEVSKIYELHVYTMGTRAYAQNIAKIVDPQQKYFGNRVISRDENGNISSKSLQRLFPVNTNMVVIIDDRSDVWPRNRRNLIKVWPYDFYKGIGDINSSFLPKRHDLLNGSEANGKKEKAKPKPASALDDLVSMSSGENKELQKKQTKEQEQSLEKQISERPLAHMQEELEKDDDEPGSDSAPGHVLSDDDQELVPLQNHLTSLHTHFYENYTRRCEEAGQAPAHEASSDRSIDLDLVPDVGASLSLLKSNALSGTVIVLSGIIPLEIDVLQSETALQLMSFGAQVHKGISKQTTHLVLSNSRLRTQKAQQARLLPRIRIVNQSWLADCMSQWRRVSEGEYLVDVPERGEDDESDEERLGIRTNGEEEGVEPEDGDMSPIEDLEGFDWGGCDDELREFLDGEDISDTESESGEKDEESEQEGEGEKAKEGEEEEEDEGKKSKAGESEEEEKTAGKRKAEDDDEGDGSALARKRRVMLERGGSGLKVVRTPESLREERAREEEDLLAEFEAS